MREQRKLKNDGKNRFGTQRCKCKNCNITYTFNPKQRVYSEEVRQDAIKTYHSGISGRGVGRLKGFSKANVYNWIKKASQIDKIWISEETGIEIFEMDELYHFIEYKPIYETRKNVYVMTLINRDPRQIIGFDVAKDKSPDGLQAILDSAPKPKTMPLMDI